MVILKLIGAYNVGDSDLSKGPLIIIEVTLIKAVIWEVEGGTRGKLDA